MALSTSADYQRNKTAAVLCGWILRLIATERFRRDIAGRIRSELEDVAEEVALGEDHPAARGLRMIHDAAANATPEDRARAARMLARIEAREAERFCTGRQHGRAG